MIQCWWLRLLRKACRLFYGHNPTSHTLLNYRNLKNNDRKNLICAKNEHLSKKLISLDNDNQKPHLLYATPEQLPILFDTFFLKNLHDIISSLATHKRLSSVIYCDSYFHEFILPPLYDISSILEATYSCSLLLSSKNLIPTLSILPITVPSLTYQLTQKSSNES